MISYSFNISHSLICPKTWGKRPKRLKYLNLIIFRKFEHACLPTKTKNHMTQKNCDSYHFMQFQYIPLFNLPKILRKRTQTTKNSWKWSFFVGLSTLSCWPRLQIKLKPIRHATSCATFIISCNSNISKFLTCPKTYRKCPKCLKT